MKNEQTHKITIGDSPSDVILFIENTYPKCKGFCYFSNGKLKSKDSEKYLFHFDHFHSVVGITFIN